MFGPIADLIFDAVTRLATLLGGSVGLAIIALTVAIRLALLPLTSRIAKRVLEQRQVIERLKPQLEALQSQYANDPIRLMAEQRALYRDHGIQFLSKLNVISALLQIPLFGGFYAAIRRGLGAGVRFLSIPNLGAPSFLLALILAAVTYVSILLNSPDQTNSLLVFLNVAIIFLFAWNASAAMALYWGTSSAFSMAQLYWVQRAVRKNAARVTV